MHQTAAEFCSTSSLPKDPILRREKLQDLITQIQGTYNFMQVDLLVNIIELELLGIDDEPGKIGI